MAQITVDINSGNPAFPFPQFLAYESNTHSLGNLGTQNAPGVTHAEMEQTIRDAWQIMANRFVYTGESVSGVELIKGNIGCPYDCTEGDGYALLAAAEMGDKTTFDGLWFRTHDIRLIGQPRYSDCVVPDPNYRYGRYALKDNADSAADGDYDVALALVIASKQWGENSGYTDACGNIINYKEEALKVVRGIVEKAEGDNIGDEFYSSGSIGFDGYFKGGNTWAELTDWIPVGDKAQFTGPRNQFTDYMAPSYYNAFADFLGKEGDNEDLDWNIPQFLRAEASSDWLMGKLYESSATSIPSAGQVNLDDPTNPVFMTNLDGGDFRNAWRTILNYVWHGNPSTTWNPITHQVENGGNSYEKEMGERFATFMNNPGESPWSNSCNSVGGGPALTYNGPSQLKYFHDANTGGELTTFNLNWVPGVGATSAVAAQDFDLMGKLYRQCAIEWDTTSAGDGYLTSVPGYFHGFFRLLGMLTATGNHHSPAEIELQSNVKVYHKLDKTFAFTGDELEYTISYRNYASIDAENVQISTVLPEGLSFVSSAGASHSAGSVTWDLGVVSGFRTSTGVEAASGEIKMKVVVDSGFSGRICSPFEITTSNGKGWGSNDFPNEKTAVMQRNCVDIVEKALEITKEVDYEEVNPGDVVTYEVDFENASSGGFINGGRPDVIIGYAHGGHEAEAATQNVKIRLYHGAVEPYIDYGNYRISLFLNDNAATCVSGDDGCDGVAWQLDNQIYEGGDSEAVSITSEKIIPGSDNRGSWNQRVIVKFSEQLATITPHISRYYGLEGGRVHQGGAEPLRAVWSLHNTQYSNVNWEDDWSWNPGASDGDGGLYFPVTNDFTDINNPDVPVTVYHNEACEEPSYTVDNVLVEEWDGFTWRRAYGNSPVPGRETNTVIVKDVLPEGFTFVGFVDDKGVDLGDSITILGEPVTYNEATRTITWTKSILQVKESGSFKYKAIADFSSGTCIRADEKQINTASIEAENESPVIVESIVNVTCEPVILPPAESSMVKEVSPVSAEVGEQVEYTLSYKNTDGSPFQSDFTEEWTVREGSAFTINSTGLTNVANNVHISTNNFSHGINGIIEATLEFNDNAQFGFALRYEGDLSSTGIDNGYYLLFKPNSGSGNVETTLYKGLNQVGDVDGGSLKISSSLTTDVKIELIDEKINIWMGDTSSPIPSLTFEGIDQKPGYVGVINGSPSGGDNYGVHKLTSFYSAMDSAFNLQIVDPVPGELEFVSSDSGELINGRVTFPMQVGPVLANEEFLYTWNAEIINCPSDTKKIENIAYTNIFGLEENSIAAQAILDCSGADLCEESPVAPLLINGDEISICLGGTEDINVADYVETTSIDYELIWFDGPSSFDNKINTPVIDTTVEGENVFYVAQIEDDICGEGVRVALTFNINGNVDSVIVTNLETCLNSDASTIDLADNVEATGEIIWYSGETTTESIEKPTIDTSIAGDISYFVSQQFGDCESDRAELVVSIGSVLTVPVVNGVSLCLNDSTNVDLADNVEATGDLVWYSDNESTSESIDKPVIDTSVAGEFTYYVSQFSGDCESDRAELVVSIGSVLTAPIVTDINETVCVFETEILNVSSSVTATGELLWYLNDTDQTAIEEPTYSLATEFSGVYYVSQFNGECESERVVINVNVEASNIQIPTNVLIGIYSNNTLELDIATELGIGTNEFVWQATDNANVQGETISISSNPFIEDTLINNSNTEQIVEYIITPVVCGYYSEYIVLVTVKPLPIVEIIASSVIEEEPIEIQLMFSEPTIAETTIVLSFTPTSVNGVTSADIDLTDELIIVPQGATVYNLTRETNFDDIVEENESLIISIKSVNPENLSNTATSQTVDIIDNDGVPNVVLKSFQIEEGDSVELGIELSNPALDDVTLTIQITESSTTTDYTITNQTVTFAKGAINPVVPIIFTAINDSLIEGDEVYTVSVLSVAGGTLNNTSALAEITILDKTIGPDIIIGDDSTTEGSFLTIPITLTSAALDFIELIVVFQDLDASGGLDYDDKLQTLQFNIGETKPIVPLSIKTLDDDIPEINEDFGIEVLVVSGTINDATDLGIATIIDNDSPEVVTPTPECTTITNPTNEETNVSILPTITWESVTNADGYNISLGTSLKENDIIDNEDVGDDLRYFLPFNLEEETTYYVSVVPYNLSGSPITNCEAIMFTTQVIINNRTRYGLSPNGDNINDFWEIKDIEDYPNNEVLVYNRWGDLVFRTLNYDNSFNVFKGEANQNTNLGAGELTSGTYFYEIKIDGENNFGDTKGFLVLKR